MRILVPRSIWLRAFLRVVVLGTTRPATTSMQSGLHFNHAPARKVMTRRSLSTLVCMCTLVCMSTLVCMRFLHEPGAGERVASPAGGARRVPGRSRGYPRRAPQFRT